MMNKLIQMPDGSWCDPMRITSIKDQQRRYNEFTQDFCPNAVFIDGYDGPRGFFFDTYEEAVAYRDSLAEQVNARHGMTLLQHLKAARQELLNIGLSSEVLVDFDSAIAEEERKLAEQVNALR